MSGKLLYMAKIKIRLHKTSSLIWDIHHSLRYALIQPVDTQSRLFTISRRKAFEKIVGKGENVCDQDCLFSRYLLILIFDSIFFLSSSANAFNLDQSKFCRLAESLSLRFENNQIFSNGSELDNTVLDLSTLRALFNENISTVVSEVVCQRR